MLEQDKFERLLNEIGGLKIDVTKIFEKVSHIEEMTVERIKNQEGRITELRIRVEKLEANIRWGVLAVLTYVLTRIMGLI